MGIELHGTVNRRRLLRGIAGGVAGFGLLRAAAAADPDVRSVAPGLTLLTGHGGNVLVYETQSGKVLVDSGAAASSQMLLKVLSELPGGPVGTLFNTHWHLDQVGSNEALGTAGATIFAHAKTRQRLSTGYYVPDEDRYEPPLAAAGRPTEWFRTEGSTIVGGRRIEYGYLLEAHTDGDLYVFFPDINVVAVGDAVSPERDPVLDWFGGGWLGGRLDALSRLLEIGNADTRFVPSYGPAVGRQALLAEQAVMQKLYDTLLEHVRLGESAADMLKLGLADGLGRTFDDPAKLLYDAHKGFWAHHNALSHDIV